MASPQDPLAIGLAADRIEAVLQPEGRCAVCGGGMAYWRHGGPDAGYHLFQVVDAGTGKTVPVCGHPLPGMTYCQVPSHPITGRHSDHAGEDAGARYARSFDAVYGTGEGE
jgi:hypothetical protein